MEDALSTKTVLDNRKDIEKKNSVTNATSVDGCTNWLRAKNIFLIKNVADYKLFMYASTRWNNS